MTELLHFHFLNGSQNLGKPSLPTRLLIYYKRILENKNQQPEEQIPWAKLEERAQNFHFHSRCATFPNPHVFTIMKVLQSLSFWIFMEASLHRQDWLNHWPLLIDSTTSSLSFQELRARDQILFHCTYHSRNSKDFGRCEPGTMDKALIYIWEVYIFSSKWPNTLFPISYNITGTDSWVLIYFDYQYFHT